jgi:hypothetical protein
MLNKAAFSLDSFLVNIACLQNVQQKAKTVNKHP